MNINKKNLGYPSTILRLPYIFFVDMHALKQLNKVIKILKRIKSRKKLISSASFDTLECIGIYNEILNIQTVMT